MSVQSWFIEREEGIGFQIGSKKEKNYSRWAKDKEIQTGLDVVAVDLWHLKQRQQVYHLL